MKFLSSRLPARTSPLRHRMRLPLVGLALLGSLLLNGCAVMSAEECIHADWYALGQADGAKGRDRQYLQFRRRFDAGRAIYDTRQEVKRLQERINDKERELTQTHKDEERKLRDPKSADERRRIQRDFEQRRHRLRSEIEQLDRQLYRARDQQYDAERRGRQHQ